MLGQRQQLLSIKVLGSRKRAYLIFSVTQEGYSTFI